MTQALSERPRLAALAWLATMATALAFAPALVEQGFLVVGGGVLAAAVVIGCLLRAARAPAAVVLGAQLVAVSEALIVGYGDGLRFGVIPTRATVNSLESTVRKGIEVAQTYEAPAPASVGLTLMVAFGICVVGVLVDFLAVTLRRTAVAGLPLLLLYAVPVAVLPDGVPFLAFLPGAIGYLALVMVDQRDRLAHWGRLVARSDTGADSGRVDTSGLTSTGRRVSASALALAVVLPVFIPTFGDTFLGGSGNGPGTGPGSGDLSFEDPVVSLAASLRRPAEIDVLQVTGDVRPQYLRLVVLDRADGNGWSASPVDMGNTLATDEELPPPVGLREEVRSTPHTMTIDTTDGFPGDSSWLPVPFAARSVSVAARDWRFVQGDSTVTAAREDSAADLGPYTTSYATLDPTPEQLASAELPPQEIRARFGQVPAGVPPVVGDTARAVASGADNHYEQAVMLQDWFRDRSNFRYDVDTGYGYGFDAMSTFLDKRRGFCQHFAATMAIMARELGIPSRVAVGFLQPERRDGDAWVLTSHDVHSWPELYFTGVGWVRFEPTPGRGAPIPAWTAEQLRPDSAGQANVPTPAALQPTPERPQPTRRDPETGAAAGADGGGGPSTRWLVGLLVAVLALLPAAARSAVRRRRLAGKDSDAAVAESAWRELRDIMLDLRLPWTGSLTPRARERTLAPYLNGDASSAAALRRLALSVERARYARSALPGANPVDDLRAVMAAVTRGVDRNVRIRARLLPASLIPDARTTLERLTDRLRRRG